MKIKYFTGYPSSQFISCYEDQVFHWLALQTVISCYEDQYFTGYPSSQLISCYENQIFHRLPLQSVHLQRKSTTLLSFMQTFISSNQTTFWEGGWGEGGGSNKIKHVSCDQITKNIQAGQHKLHQTLNIFFTLALK